MSLAMEEKQRINPGLSAVLSFLFNGLGQIYNGQIKKAVGIICLSWFGMFVILMGAFLIGHSLLGVLKTTEVIVGLALLILGIVLIAVIGIYSLYDAYNTARKRLLG